MHCGSLSRRTVQMTMRFLRRLAERALCIGLVMVMTCASHAASDSDIAGIVERHIRPMLEDVGGVAVAVRDNGRTLFFNYGNADSTNAITSDSLFNLGSVGKVFDTALLALADEQGELKLDDPVAKYVIELQEGADISRVTLQQLATYTSGFVLPEDHPPWSERSFALPEFIATLNAWRSDKQHEPGKQKIYSHAGFVLLHLALERRFGLPFHELMQQRVLGPLGLHSTTLPTASSEPDQHPQGVIPDELARRAVQGYSDDDEPIGAPGDLQGYYHWLGTGQMYSSARDMSVFLAANLGDLPDQPVLGEAMRRAQQTTFPLDKRTEQALAWEVHKTRLTIVDKYGGMNNASAYIGLAPDRKVGVVILSNRGDMDVERAGRRIVLALARAS
jgi:beta-lactamase class C